LRGERGGECEEQEEAMEHERFWRFGSEAGEIGGRHSTGICGKFFKLMRLLT
jgi:hypothetical protein